MKIYLGAIAIAAVVGCGGSGPAGNDLGIDMPAPADLSMGDGPVGNGKIGAACLSTADCTEGMTPDCWKKELFNAALYLPTPGGYCSSKCTADTDCGSNGVCNDFGGTIGKWCLAKCAAPSDCRSPAYGCFTGAQPSCFPVGGLDCDPTAGDGSCVTSKGKAGGCQRAMLGGPTVNKGTTGFCTEECEAGVDTCSTDTNGPRKCLVDDERQNTDEKNMLYGDKWAGPLCFSVPPAGTPIFQDGQECTCTVNGQSLHCIDVCVDGSECYVQSMGDMMIGDNLCHAFCYFGAMSVPDGGFDFTDAGVVASTTCASGTCTDVWQLKNTSRPVGLCL